MLQPKTLRLVEKGDSEEKTSYNSYIDESIDKWTNLNQYDPNIKELNKTFEKKDWMFRNQTLPLKLTPLDSLKKNNPKALNHHAFI